MEHISHDEQDSNDNNRMMQQLYSMNIMSYEGWEPDIQLWEVGFCCLLRGVIQHCQISGILLLLHLLQHVAAHSTASSACTDQQDDVAAGCKPRSHAGAPVIQPTTTAITYCHSPYQHKWLFQRNKQDMSLPLQEPGTAMSGIYVKESDDGKSPALYVTPATTEQQCQELMEDVRVLYQGYSRRNSWLGPIAAAAASSSAAATAATATAETPSVLDEPESWEVVVVCPAAAEGGSPEFHRVQATDSMTVRLLKRQLIQQWLPGSSPATLRVFERCKELQDHVLVPCQQGAFLRVLMPGQQPPNEQPTYQLYIKTLHGFTCEVIDCGPGSFVGELKGAAGLQLGQTPAQLRLIFAGKQLQDESLLEQYHIQKECTINCVQMRGVP